MRSDTAAAGLRERRPDEKSERQIKRRKYRGEDKKWGSIVICMAEVLPILDNQRIRLYIRRYTASKGSRNSSMHRFWNKRQYPCTVSKLTIRCNVIGKNSPSDGRNFARVPGEICQRIDYWDWQRLRTRLSAISELYPVLHIS